MGEELGWTVAVEVDGEEEVAGSEAGADGVDGGGGGRLGGAGGGGGRGGRSAGDLCCPDTPASF